MQDHSRVHLNYEEPSSTQNLHDFQGLPSIENLKSRHLSKKVILQPMIQSPSPNKYNRLNEDSPTKMSSSSILPSPFKINPKTSFVDDQVSDNYKLANYETSRQFFRQQGYFKRTVMNHKIIYTPTTCCDQNLDFLNQYHSTGVYFYFELLKRFLFLLFFCSCLSGVQLYNNYAGTKLSGYTRSFSTILAYFSLGNNDGSTQTQMYIQCGLATLQTLALIFFYIQWRIASNQILKEYLENPLIMEPQRYALTVSGIKYTSHSDSLAKRFHAYLERLGYNIHQCQVIQDFDNNFNDFVKLQKIMNQLQQQKCLTKQGKGSNQKIESLKQDKQKLLKQIQQDNTPIRPLLLIVHFQTKLDKAKFVKSFKHNNKQNTCGSNFTRCFCCYKPTENQLFEDQLVLLQNEMIGRPDDIYWQNMDASFCSKFWRFLIGFIVILVSLVVTSTVIACCILYASGASSCSEYIPNSTLASVLGNQNLLYCFCQENILSSDTTIVTACSSVNRTILINNALLIVSSIASALTNIILGLIVQLIISFMRPRTRSKQYQANFIIIIIATLINSCFLPLVLNASIFGYTPNAYLRIFNFINFTNVKIVSDFVPDWYVFISPYYINLFLVAIALPWVNLFKCLIVNAIRRCMIKSKLGEILQKTADAMIVGYKFDMAAQNALIIVNTLICFTYSTALPLLPLLHFASICSIYITNRIILTRYSRKVSLDQQLNNIIIHIIPFIIILQICFSIWALTSDTLFSFNLFSNTTFNFQILQHTEFKRIFYFLPLTACLAIVVVFLIIDYILIRLIASCCKDNAVYPESIDQSQFFSNRARDKNILNSYRFEKNPDYKNVLGLVQEMLRKTVGGK